MSVNFHDFWKGHLLQFERPSSPKYDDATGWRLLIAFGILAFLVIPAFRFGLHSSGLSTQEWSSLLLVCMILAAFFLTIRTYVKVDSRIIGLHDWVDWTSREKVYLFQTLPLLAVLFIALFQQHFRQLIDNYGLVGFVAFSALTGLLWGVVQEFIYRGLLQTELVRRFGAIGGVLIANLVFTAGPLHLEYFHLGTDMRSQRCRR